jgi:D-alanine-D-alanine ligase
MDSDKEEDRMKKKVVGVLMGGISSEREVSLRTGEAIASALERLSHPVRRIVVDEDIIDTLKRSDIDTAFIALHGTFGEDGCIQGLLELLCIPYTGSGVMASALAMDKLKSKELFRLHNIPTPPYYVVGAEDLSRIDDLHGSFGFPVIVKPRREGSSVGISIIRRPGDLGEAVEKAMKWDEDVIVERYISGKEIAVGLLNGRVLGAIEVVPDGEFYDYHAKYNSKRTNYYFPARLSPTRYRCVLTLAEHANKVLGCTGATRVDLIVTEGENEYVLELDTLPGLTETSLLPKIAAGAGYSFESLVEAMLERAACHCASSRPVRIPSEDADRDDDENKVVSLRSGRGL